MGSDYAGGYIFFSALRDRQALIELVLRTMELTPEDKLGIWLPRDDDHYPSNLPNEQALRQLAQAEDGDVVVKEPWRPEWYEFDQPAGPYQTVAVSCIINALDGKINPGGGDLLARRWLALCEEGKADFDFFSEFEITGIEQRDALLPTLLQKDAKKLMENWGSYWLIYLGPELGQLWRVQKQPIEAVEQRWLPSGAFFAPLTPTKSNRHFFNDCGCLP